MTFAPGMPGVTGPGSHPRKPYDLAYVEGMLTVMFAKVTFPADASRRRKATDAVALVTLSTMVVPPLVAAPTAGIAPAPWMITHFATAAPSSEGAPDLYATDTQVVHVQVPAPS